jgi:hypothetical protein
LGGSASERARLQPINARLDQRLRDRATAIEKMLDRLLLADLGRSTLPVD